MTHSLLILLELNCKCRHRAMQEVECKTLLQEDGPQHHPFWLTSLPLWGWKLIICWGLAPATKYDTYYDRLVCWPDSMELGERHCFAVVLSSSMEKNSKAVSGDCLCSLSLIQRTHEDGGASYSPTAQPCNKWPRPGTNRNLPPAGVSRQAKRRDVLIGLSRDTAHGNERQSCSPRLLLTGFERPLQDW